MMAAARGAGVGGEAYADILNILWQAHKKCGTEKNCLNAKDTRHKWNVLMHSAKCGDPNNLQIVLSMYKDTFGSYHMFEDEIDWANVDHKVKKLVSKEVFAGDAAPVSNYSRSKRTSRRGGRQSNHSPSMTARSPPWATATVKSPANANDNIETDGPTPQAVVDLTSADEVVDDEDKDNEKGKCKEDYVASGPDNYNPAGNVPVKTEVVNDHAPTQSIKVDDNDHDDAYSQVTQPLIADVGDNMTLCQQELKRSRENEKRQADEIKRLKKAIKALAS